jgi:3-oxoadipate enol-lactonase
MHSDDDGSFVELADRGVRLCFVRGGDGDGPPLLVINGTGSDLRNRPNAVQWSIAEHFDVLTYDHRCLGRSEPADPDHQPTMADFAEDALALCASQGLERFAVIGISFGGMVAQEVAIRGGDRIESLVLCCTSSGGAGGSSYPLHEVYSRGWNLEEMLGRWDTRAPHDQEVAERLMRFFAGRTARPAEPPPGLLKQLEARRHHDTYDRLGEIGCPTLVAYGRYDGTAKPANSEALARRIPDARAEGFDGGHMFLWQDPSAWPRISGFLQGP